MYQGKYERRPAAPAQKEQHVNSVPANNAAPIEQPKPAENITPVRPVRRAPKKVKKADPKRGTLIFYSAYAAFILVFFIVILCLMQPLNDWLIKYEASQPNYARTQVFNQLFADPDWEALYSMAGVEDSTFETGKDYATYMQELVGTDKLTCMETSAGLSGDKKFIIKHGSSKIASFTLTNKASSEEIAQWELNSLELNVTANKSVLIGRIPGQTVYLNGVEVSNRYIARTEFTIAEDYLPDGVHGYRMEYLLVDGLFTYPQVSVKNADGTDAVLIKGEKDGEYTVQVTTVNDMTDEEKLLALNATKTYAKYMIGKTNLADVKKYYETSSQFYKTISRSEVGWAQNAASYNFTDPTYTEFYRYSDKLFSVRIDMALRQTRFDGSVKENSLNNTLFFRKNSSGKWMVMEATNVAVQELKSQVRLTFLNAEEIVLDTMIDSDVSYLDLPTVTAPEDKEFAGWATQEIDDNGNVTLTIVFTPENSNRVYFGDQGLEPMRLYAHFQEATE